METLEIIRSVVGLLSILPALLAVPIIFKKLYEDLDMRKFRNVRELLEGGGTDSQALHVAKLSEEQEIIRLAVGLPRRTRTLMSPEEAKLLAKIFKSGKFMPESIRAMYAIIEPHEGKANVKPGVVWFGAVLGVILMLLILAYAVLSGLLLTLTENLQNVLHFLFSAIAFGIFFVLFKDERSAFSARQYRERLADVGLLAGDLHERVAKSIAQRLNQYVGEENEHGFVYTSETGFKLAGGSETVRVPDVAFMSRARVEAVGEVDGVWPEAPALAVEVVSPGDTYAEVEEKVFDWLESGAKEVVVINPRTRTATVYRSRSEIAVISEDDVLDGGDAVPGFRLPLREVLA